MKRFQRVSLRGQKSRLLERKPPQPELLFEYACDYCAGRPSIWCCRDHSAGRSVRRATPIPWGSLPSMAALTRSGARKGSEIVMLIFRALHRSRFAMLSALAVGLVMSSTRQRRHGRSPRPISPASPNVSGEPVLAGVFRQGTARAWWLGKLDDQPVPAGPLCGRREYG
jgi:hypothetical protein